MLPYTPLVDPEPVVVLPAWLERASSVPVARWLVGAIRRARWRRRKAEEIVRQMIARDGSTMDAWGENAERRHVAAVVCDAIRTEFGWPNSNYVPDDALNLLTWRVVPDREWIFALFEMEERLGVDIVYSDLPEGENTTLGRIVDYFVGLCHKKSDPAKTRSAGRR